jgi:hypothetical protein
MSAWQVGIPITSISHYSIVFFSKLKTTIRYFYQTGDGLIQEKELAHVMRACMDENGMKFDEGEVDELTR